MGLSLTLAIQFARQHAMQRLGHGAGGAWYKRERVR